MRRLGFRVAAAALGIGFVLILGEIGVRTARSYAWGSFAKHRAFAHPFCDPDYQKLRLLDVPNDVPLALEVNGFERHPVLGWAPDADLAHDLGLLAGGRPQRADVALFGDSFTAGVPPSSLEERIGAVLDEMLPDQRVLNYAVPGYGIDQIYLRYLQVASDERTRPGTAVVAILVDDIDRVLQPLRAGPKPLFELGDGGLVLRNVPIEQSPREWLRDHPISLRSYLASYLHMRWLALRPDREGFYSECRREEKEAIAGTLIEEFVADAERRGIRLLFVILYGEKSIKRPSWRGEFLRDRMRELGADFVDTLPTLRAAEETEGGLEALFYPPPNNHLNLAGNELIAGAIRDGILGTADSETNEPLLLTRGGNGLFLLGEGWHDADVDRIWSSAPTATLWVPARPGEPALLQVRFVNVARFNPDARTLTVTVAGRPVYQRGVASFPRGFDGWVAEIPVPASAITSTLVPIRFELPFLVRPVDVGTGKDGRALGIAVHSISLEQGHDTRAAIDATTAGP